jgi:sugar lactone lactonase YvrE
MRFIILSVFFIVTGMTVDAQIINTIAGTKMGGYGPDTAVATTSKLNYPTGVAIDKSGNLYIADANNNRVRKVTTAGIITTIAGTGKAGYGGDGRAATGAQLKYPTDVAVDDAGDVYVTDYRNSRIRKITTSGTISTVAGNGTIGVAGDGGPAYAAQLHDPAGIAVDADGNLYIADKYNYRVRKIDRQGMIMTVAGNGYAGWEGDRGAATNARLNNPTGVTVDADGYIYIADRGNHCIRKVTPKGIITTIAGIGVQGFSGDDGPATAAKMNQPASVTVDKMGNVYVIDLGNNRIRKIDQNGVISSIAGGAVGPGGDGGPAQKAFINFPTSIVADSLGNVLIADAGNHKVRIIQNKSWNLASTHQHTEPMKVYTYPGKGAMAISLHHTAPGVKIVISDMAGRVLETLKMDDTNLLMTKKVYEQGTYLVKAYAADAVYIAIAGL